MNIGTVCLGGVFLAFREGRPAWVVCRDELADVAVERAAKFIGAPLSVGEWEQHRPGLLRCPVEVDLSWS